MSPDVRAAFDAFPIAARERLLAIRDLILNAAVETQTGPLTETLKWSQPAYLTEVTKSGTTIRLGLPKGDPSVVALFVHCQSNLVERWRATYGNDLRFEGNRAVLVPIKGQLPEKPLLQIVQSALTYHWNKNR